MSLLARRARSAPDPARVVPGHAAFAGVVFTPVLSSYCGLTGAAVPVFAVVVPSMVGWFVLLSIVYRFRLIDRVPKVGQLPGTQH